jgi:hypothetical protein
VGILYAAGALIWLYWYITTFRAVVPANRHPSPRLYSNPITSTSPAASSTSSSTGSVIPSQSPDPLLNSPLLPPLTLPHPTRLFLHILLRRIIASRFLYRLPLALAPQLAHEHLLATAETARNLKPYHNHQQNP